MDINTVIADLEAIVGPQHVLRSRAERAVYGYDASVFRGTELLAVVLPTTAEQISRLVVWVPGSRRAVRSARHRHRHQRRRIPTHGGVVIELALMNQVLEVDLANRLAVVQPGVVNQDLKRSVQQHGYAYTYVPDPGSQVVSTIGGNVATNAGGMHCLKYGITGNHILGLEMVLPDGDIVAVGGKAVDQPGADLTGLLVGSEGTLGVRDQDHRGACCKCPRRSPPTWRCSKPWDDAANTVSGIISSGLLPAAMELLDKSIMQAVDKAVHIGFRHRPARP